MQPTLRQLEYLVAIAESGSFQGAARACHVTQPALSAQIQQLEGFLGVQVLERDRRKVLVTAAGEDMVRRARALLSDVGQLVDAARNHCKPLTGRLRLGVIPTISSYLLPGVIPPLCAKYTELVLELYEGQTMDLLERLGRGELDVLLLALEAPLRGVETLPLFKDPFVLATPSTHPLASRSHVQNEDLKDEMLLLLGDGHCLRDQALAICTQQGGAECSDFRASSLPTLVQMVAMGSGVTLLPSLALRIETQIANLATIPFLDPAPYRTVGLAWRPTSLRVGEFKLMAEFIRRSACG